MFNCFACGTELKDPLKNPGCVCDQCYSLKDTHILLKCNHCKTFGFKERTEENIEELKQLGLKWKDIEDRLSIILVKDCNFCVDKLFGKMATA